MFRRGKFDYRIRDYFRESKGGRQMTRLDRVANGRMKTDVEIELTNG